MSKETNIQADIIIEKVKKIVSSIPQDEKFLTTLLSLSSALFNVSIKAFSVLYEKDENYARKKLLKKFNEIVSKEKNEGNSNIIFDFTDIKN